MDEKEQLRKLQELFQVQRRIREMRAQRDRDVGEWRRLIHKALKVEERIRNEISAGNWTPALPMEDASDAQDAEETGEDA